MRRGYSAPGARSLGDCGCQAGSVLEYNHLNASHISSLCPSPNTRWARFFPRVAYDSAVGIDMRETSACCEPKDDPSQRGWPHDDWCTTFAERQCLADFCRSQEYQNGRLVCRPDGTYDGTTPCTNPQWYEEAFDHSRCPDDMDGTAMDSMRCGYRSMVERYTFFSRVNRSLSREHQEMRRIYTQCSICPSLPNTGDPNRECIELTRRPPHGLSIIEMPIPANYWRVNELSNTIRRCRTPGVCNQSAANAVNTTRFDYAERLCNPTHRGTFCEACIENHYKNDDRLCIPCGRNTIAARDNVRTWLPFFALLCFRTCTRRTDGPAHEGTDNEWEIGRCRAR